LQSFNIWRIFTRVGNPDKRALAMQPLGHRQSGLTEPDNQNAFAPKVHV